MNKKQAQQKILLISPPLFDFYFTPGRSEPVGLLYIKKALEDVPGVKVSIYDTVLSGKKKRLTRPPLFDYLGKYYYEDRSYFSLLANYFRFGDSFQKIVGAVKEGAYDIVGISSNFSGYYPDVEDLVIRIKTETKAKIVLGGWSIKAEGERIIEKTAADYLLCGNGEVSFPLLVKAMQGEFDIYSVPGILFRENGAVVKTDSNIETPIPQWFPQRENSYYFNRKRIASVVASRGCPNKCSFCSIPQYHIYSLRSIESLRNELDYLLHLGIEIVNFEDDNILCNGIFSGQLLDMFKEYHQKGLSFTAMNGLTADKTLPYVDDMIDAGFIEFNLSLVTSADDIVGRIKRPFQFETIKELIKKINGRVKTQVFCILGLPGTSIDSAVHDIIELAKLPVLMGVSPLYLLPGVAALERLGLPEERRLMRGSSLYKFDNAFTRDDIASLWKIVRMINRIKIFTEVISEEDRENLSYFSKSLKEKCWFRKGKDGSWEKAFSFSLEFPKELDIYLYYNNEVAKFKL